jgi:hypothetical protein
MEQLARAKVREGIPTFLHLSVDAAMPNAPIDDGPLPVRAPVYGPGDQLYGEVLVWVSNGYLSGLEYAWVTDDAPASMPSADWLRPVNTSD